MAAVQIPPSMSTMMGLAALSPTASRKARAEGDIGSVFASLSGESEAPLPTRFLDLKLDIIGDKANQAALQRAWGTLLERLAQLAPQIEQQQQDLIPQTTYDDFINNPTPALLARIRECGSVVVRDVIPQAEAEGWLASERDYIAANPSVKGFPAGDPQVYELYWSKPQLAARSHPRALAVQKALLQLFSCPPETKCSLDVPLTYCDRLRIRTPGDAKFALGPHMDGGSIERWEDPDYRAVYEAVLKGQWENFDAWDMKHRATANQNLYDCPGACAVFRAFQGWTSLSSTGPGEGTLRVFPYIREMTAYTLMRPLFREKQSRAKLDTQSYLSASNWELDQTSSRFPGAPPGRGQELNDSTHPHLQLNKTMVSMPHVNPGDQVWWHGDAIHSVESQHRGKGASSVLYIPAVPLTAINVDYLKDQRECFFNRIPPPDFPGGVGESQFTGTGTETDIDSPNARQAMGLQPFSLDGDLSSGERSVRQQANALLGF